MKCDRGELEEQLLIVIKQYVKDRNVKIKIQDYFKKNHNMLPGEGLSILTGSTPITTLSHLILCIFTQALFSATQEKKINPNNFFTDLEIKEANEWKVDLEVKPKYPIKILNVTQINNDMWATKATIQDFVDLYSRHVTYNFETQREKKIKTYKDKIIEEINMNKKAIQEIKTKILDETFITNYIVLNILQTGTEQFEYDEKENTLTIYAGELDIIDGYHRATAMQYALMDNSNIKYNTGITFVNFDVDKAKRYMVQEDKKNKMKKNYIKSLNTDSIANLIVKKINENSNSHLNGKITTEKIFIERNKALVLFDVLSDAIEFTFSPRERNDLIRYSNRIIEGINYIVETQTVLLDKPVDHKHWCYYITFIYCTLEMENWKNIISELLHVKDTKSFAEIKVINKKSMGKIIEQVKTIIDELQ